MTYCSNFNRCGRESCPLCGLDFRDSDEKTQPVELPEKDANSTTHEDYIWVGEVNKALNDALTLANLRAVRYEQLLKRLRDQAERTGWHNLVHEIDSAIDDPLLRPEPNDMKGA